MELVRAPEFISYMFEIISAPNRRLIRELLYDNCIDYFELHFNLLNLFCYLYHKCIPCSIFDLVVNTTVTSYLMSVKTSQKCKYWGKTPVGCAPRIPRLFTHKYVDECILHNVCDIYSSHSSRMDECIVLPVEIVDTSKGELSDGKNTHKESDNVTHDKDFQSFLLPLEQDYTKSSKGYSSHVTSNDDKAYSTSEIEDDSTPLTGSFVHILKLSKSSSDNTESKRDEIQTQLKKESCMEIVEHDPLVSSNQNSDSDSSTVICEKYVKVTRNISSTDDVSPNHRSIAFSENSSLNIVCNSKSPNDSEAGITFQKTSSMKIVHNNVQISDDSDSNDSVEFPKTCSTKTGNNSLHFINDSDSDDYSTETEDKILRYDDDSDCDDDIVFSEICGTKKKDNGLHYDNDSDSSNSIEFSESCSTKSENNSWNYDDDSDSADSIVFSEEVNGVEQSSTLSINITQFCCSPTNFGDSESSEDADWDNNKYRENEPVSPFEDSDFEFSYNDLSGQSLGSSSHLYVSITQMSTDGCINPCFEDDDDDIAPSSFSSLQNINDSWNNAMKDVSSEPHESKRVSFLPLPDLVSIHSFQPDDDGYRYSLYVLDQIRFQNRIKDFETIISPYLSPEHRANFYRQNYTCIKNGDDSDIVRSSFSHLENINDSWNSSMKDVSSKSRKSKGILISGML